MRSEQIRSSIPPNAALMICLVLASLRFGCGVAQARDEPNVYRCTLFHGGSGLTVQIDRDVTGMGRLILENTRVDAESFAASNGAFELDSGIEYRADANGPAPAVLTMRARLLSSRATIGASGAHYGLRLASRGRVFTLDPVDAARFQFDWLTFEQIFEGVDMVLAELTDTGPDGNASRPLGVAAVDLRLLRRGAAMKEGAERKVDSLASEAASECSPPGSEAGMLQHHSDCSETWSSEGMTYAAMPGTVSWRGPLGGNFHMTFFSTFRSYYDFARLGFPRMSLNGLPASVAYQDDNSVWDRRGREPAIIRTGNPLRQEITIRTGDRVASGWYSVPIPLDWVKDTSLPADASAELTVRTRADGEIARLALPRSIILAAEAALQAGYQRMSDNMLEPARRCRWTRDVIGGPSDAIIVTDAKPARGFAARGK